MRLPFLLLIGAWLCAAAPLRFQITLDPAVAPKGASGRLFVFLQKGGKVRDRIPVGFIPEGVWLAGREVAFWKPGAVVELNGDEAAFPQPLSQVAKGDYAVMALLDPDHSFARARQDAGDLTSVVMKLKGFDPAKGEPVALRITRVTPDAKAKPDTAHVKAVEFVSPALMAFWGRPVTMRAGDSEGRFRAVAGGLPCAWLRRELHGGVGAGRGVGGGYGVGQAAEGCTRFP